MQVCSIVDLVWKISFWKLNSVLPLVATYQTVVSINSS